MEQISKLITRNQIILARVYYLLQVFLSLGKVTCKHVSLTGHSPGKALRDTIGTFLVCSRLTLKQVGNCSLTLLSYPLEVLLLGHLAIGRRIRHRNRLGNVRGLSPVARKQEIVVGAKHTGLSHTLLHELSRILNSLKLLDDEVVGEDREVKTLIVIVNSLRSMPITELVYRSTKLMVTVHSTTVVHIIARVVSHNPCRGIDTRAHGTTHGVTLELLVCRAQSVCKIVIRLVEGGSCQTGLLSDVELIITC